MLINPYRYVSGNLIESSLMLDSASSQYLSRTPASSDNAKYTVSLWLKRGKIGGRRDPIIEADSNSRSYIAIENAGSNGDNITICNNGTAYITTSALFRDPTSWYHLVVSFNGSISSGTITLYINGDSIATATGCGSTSKIGSNVAHKIGRDVTSSLYFDGYISDFILVTGQALAADSFGKYDNNGHWSPKTYTGNVGTNGCHLDFSNGSNLGEDAAGSNDWAVNGGISSVNQVVDSPTNNYCVLNALDNGGGATLSKGNLGITSAAAFKSCRGTFAIPDNAKTYFEMTVTSATSSSVAAFIGLATSTTGLTNSPYNSSTTGCYGIYVDDYRIVFANGANSSSTSATIAAGAIMQVAADSENDKVWIGINNSWYDAATTTNGNPSTGTNQTFSLACAGLFPFAGMYSNTGTFNFGQRAFAHTPPTGFVALCTSNLDTPTIADSTDAFDVRTHSGSESAVTINDLNFAPNLVWIKRYQTAGTDHNIFDTTRPSGESYSIEANTTDAETNISGVSLDSAGITLPADTVQVSDVGYDYVDFFWREGASYGLDIVSYSGTGSAKTVSHGLGVAPALIMVKETNSSSYSWAVYHHKGSASPETGLLVLNSTAVFATDSTVWNDTAPTSSLFTVGTSNSTNKDASSYMAYCFSEIESFSKFGWYAGNGNVVGPYIHCGFRPKFLIIKTRTTNAQGWIMWDAERSPYNVVGAGMYVNSTSGYVSDVLDLTANGFKLRAVNAPVNSGSATYVFIAFAESPFKYSLAR